MTAVCGLVCHSRDDPTALIALWQNRPQHATLIARFVSIYMDYFWDRIQRTVDWWFEVYACGHAKATSRHTSSQVLNKGYTEGGGRRKRVARPAPRLVTRLGRRAKSRAVEVGSLPLVGGVKLRHPAVSSPRFASLRSARSAPGRQGAGKRQADSTNCTRLVR